MDMYGKVMDYLVKNGHSFCMFCKQRKCGHGGNRTIYETDKIDLHKLLDFIREQEKE